MRSNFKEIFVNMRDWIDLARDRDHWRAPGSISNGVS